MDKEASPWTKKYTPQKKDDIAGQDGAVDRVFSFVRDYNKGDKPLLLYGPTGTGKTVAAYTAGKKFDLEILEVNASDTRNKKSINSLVGESLKQKSLFSKGKLVIVDEVDGLSGRKDRGATSALGKLMKKSPYPVIIIANDISLKKLSSLKKKCRKVEFKPLSYKSILKRLEFIAKEENIEYDRKALKSIARWAGGDMRAAINDFQTAEFDGKLTKENLDVLGEREKTEKIKESLLRVFKTTKADIARGAFDNVDQDYDKVFLWIDNNLSKEYSKIEDLSEAYDCLSLADVFRGRIHRWQHYRFLVYIYDLLTAGIALSKKEKYKKKVTYERSKRLLKIWITNRKYSKRDSISEKLAEKTHSSKKRVLKDSYPYLLPLLSEKDSDVAEFLELEDKEVEWVKKKGFSSA